MLVFLSLRLFFFRYDQGLKFHDILTIYRVSMSIDTIYSIDNRLTRQKIGNIGYISVWGQYMADNFQFFTEIY